MPTPANIAIRFSELDKRALLKVSERLCGGNQSETLRRLVREAAARLEVTDISAGDGAKKPHQKILARDTKSKSQHGFSNNH